MSATYKVFAASFAAATVVWLMTVGNAGASRVVAGTVDAVADRLAALEKKVKRLEEGDDAMAKSQAELALRMERRIESLEVELSREKTDRRTEVDRLKESVKEMDEKLQKLKGLVDEVDRLNETTVELKRTWEHALARLAETDAQGLVLRPRATGRLVITNSAETPTTVRINGVRFEAAGGTTHLWVPIGKVYIQRGNEPPEVQDVWQFDEESKSYLMKVAA